MCFIPEWRRAEKRRLRPDPEWRWHHSDVRWHHSEHGWHGCPLERRAHGRSAGELGRSSGSRAGVLRPRAGDPRNQTGPPNGRFRAPATSGLPPPTAQERIHELNGWQKNRVSSLYHLSCGAISPVSEVAGLMSLPHSSLFSFTLKSQLFIHLSSADLFCFSFFSANQTT